MTRRRRIHLAALTVAVAVTAALPAAAAASHPPDEPGGGTKYHHVHRLRPWKHRFAYRVRREYAVRTLPAAHAPRAGQHVARGTFLPIGCQGSVRTRGGRALWDRVAGGYVPDAVMKTYTDGRLRGSPRCHFPSTHRVVRRQRWHRRSLYLVTRTHRTSVIYQAGRGDGPVIARGRWVHIRCQGQGQRVGHSRNWNRLPVHVGHYQPDEGGNFANAYIRTFYRGRIPGAPRCQNAIAGPDYWPTYAALGDSYSSGLGAPIVYRRGQPWAIAPGAGYYAHAPRGRADGRACDRSNVAYSRLLARHTLLRSAVRDTFLACQGDTTAEVLRWQVPNLPRHTKLVTLTVMGNDMGFKSVVQACATPLRSCAKEVRSQFDAHNSALHVKIGRLDAVLSAIRGKARWARIVVIGYPGLFSPPHEQRHGCLYMSEGDQRLLKRKSQALNNAIRGATRRHAGVSYVGVAPPFAGHGPCQDPSRKVWVNPILKYTGGSIFDPAKESMHPNRSGHRAIARAVRRALPRWFTG